MNNLPVDEEHLPYCSRHAGADIDAPASAKSPYVVIPLRDIAYQGRSDNDRQKRRRLRPRFALSMQAQPARSREDQGRGGGPNTRAAPEHAPGGHPW